MSFALNASIRKQVAACVTAIAVSAVAVEADAHAFDQPTSGTDADSRGNANYAARYNWQGSTRNWEGTSGAATERHSYALQIFSVGTTILGLPREIIRVSGSADSWYRKSGADAATYDRMVSAHVSINEVELIHCRQSTADCLDAREVTTQEFYRKSKSIDFGVFGAETLTSRVIGDISLNVASTASSTKYLGIATGFFSNSGVNLLVGVHVLTRQSMSGTTTKDYRLINVDIDAQERARQATYGTAPTKGTLTWENRYFVDLALMDGRIAYEKGPVIGPSVTRELVDVPRFRWTGQYI
ncbi:MAG TPA: hypothetical protein VER33_07090, partial [Polyangiaceae bacterium]|nr:hypothetical protein [Polyangiaceae bacterium]